MDNITLFCWVLFLVCFMLFLKSIFMGSKLGKATGIVLYLVFAIFFGLLVGYSFWVESDADTMSINNRKSYIKIQFRRTLPPADTPRFSDKHSPNKTLGKYNKTGAKEESKKGRIIGDTDSKIYHIPGSTYYEKEKKKESNNVYFETIEEATQAGYRAPKK